MEFIQRFILTLKALYNTLRGTLPDCLFRRTLPPRSSQSY